jgi:hypothetical protein
MSLMQKNDELIKREEDLRNSNDDIIKKENDLITK